MSVICARLSNKGKVGVQRGRETAGVPSFLPSAVGTASSPPRARRIPALRRAQLPAEVQRKTPRPSGANTLTQFACPGQPVQKRSRPSGANTLTQFACPGQPVQKRSRPSGSNPPAAVRVPRSVGAEKKPPVRGEPACGSSCALVTLCREKKSTAELLPRCSKYALLLKSQQRIDILTRRRLRVLCRMTERDERGHFLLSLIHI